MSFYIFLFVNCSLWVLGFIFGLPLQMSTCTLMFLASQGRSPEGQEAILFIDVAGVGHAFIAVMDENDVFTIYTYGQYGQGNEDGESTATGHSALVRLKGDDAYNYLKEHYEDEEHYDIRAFYLSDEQVDEEKVSEYFDEIIDDTNAIAAENKNDVKYAKGKGSKAVAYKPYSGVPNPGKSENCVTVADEGLEAGGCNLIGTQFWPYKLNAHMKVSDFFRESVNEVTDEIKKDTQGLNTGKDENESSNNGLNVSDYEGNK